jgi:hypothetical protein
MADKVYTVTFKVEKETKNTVRYEEEIGDTPPIIGTLYVQKWVLKTLGNPATLTLTLQAGGDDVRQ